GRGGGGAGAPGDPRKNPFPGDPPDRGQPQRERDGNGEPEADPRPAGKIGAREAEPKPDQDDPVDDEARDGRRNAGGPEVGKRDVESEPGGGQHHGQQEAA